MIIGLGTGRCGSVSLSKWLNTWHEFKPLFTESISKEEIEDHTKKLTGMADRWKFTPGDISLTQIYALDYWVNTDATIICLMRDREETAESIMNYRTRETWDKYFPQFDFSSIDGALRYWDWYYEKVLTHQDRIIMISPEQIPLVYNEGRKWLDNELQSQPQKT